MIKLTTYQWQDVTHCATVECTAPVYFRSWYGERSPIMSDGAATILSEENGQSIARIIIEEPPEE